MKNIVHIGLGSLTTAVAVTTENIALLIIGMLCMVYFGVRLFDKAKIQYSKKHYRRYNPLLIWAKGSWRPIREVQKILIEECNSDDLNYSLLGLKYRVYLMHGYGSDKIFNARSLKTAKQRAELLAAKYNLPVEIRAQIFESRVKKKHLTMG